MSKETVIAEVLDCEPRKPKPGLDIYFPPTFANRHEWRHNYPIQLILNDGVPWTGEIRRSSWNQVYLARRPKRGDQEMRLREWLIDLDLDHKAKLEFQLIKGEVLIFVRVIDQGHSHPKRRG